MSFITFCGQFVELRYPWYEILKLDYQTQSLLILFFRVLSRTRKSHDVRVCAHTQVLFAYPFIRIKRPSQKIIYNKANVSKIDFLFFTCLFNNCSLYCWLFSSAFKKRTSILETLVKINNKRFINCTFINIVSIYLIYNYLYTTNKSVKFLHYNIIVCDLLF